MTTVWSRIASFTQKYPLSRGMASYACIWPLGSLVQQKIQGKETMDYWRALRFSLYGCCFVAPTLYTWMTVAGYLFPKPGLRSGIYKAVVEQFTYGPFANSTFFFGMTLLEGGSLEDAQRELRMKFLPTWQTAVCVWPFVQTINFCFIPERNRVPFVSVCSFMWTVYLAYMKQRKQLVENNEPEKPVHR